MDNGFMSVEIMNSQISSTLRRVLQIIGIIITLLALAFAFQRVWAIGQSNWEKLISVKVLLIIILGGMTYGMNEFLLGWAWQKLLVWFGESTARPRICLAVYGRTQIAKYLPGNFFHYPSRHMMGNRAGFHHPALVGAMVYEIIGLLVAGGTISLIGFPKGIYLGNTIFLRLAILPIVLILPLVIQFVLTHFSIGQRLGFLEKPASDAFKELLPIWAIYLMFFIVDGVILWGIVGGSTGMWFKVPFLYMFSTFTISWVVGFITPGSPAGLGVREAVMILILTTFIGAPAAAFVALVSRLVVTLGDLVFFLLSYPLARKLDLMSGGDTPGICISPEEGRKLNSENPLEPFEMAKKVKDPGSLEISVIVVTWNSGDVLPRCLDSLAQQTCRDFEIIVVDNGSSDGTIEDLRKNWRGLSIQLQSLDKNRGFAVANNIGARLARGHWLALLNSDAFPAPDWLEKLLQATQRYPEFSFFASRQLQANMPHLLDGAGDAYHISGLAWRRYAGFPAAQFGLEPEEVFSPCAAAALYSRQAFLQVGGFDEDFFSYHEDVDLGFRLRLQGFRCLYVPDAVIQHVGSATLGVLSDFALYHWQRNFIWSFIKDMPSALLWEALPAHLMANFIYQLNYTLRGRGSVLMNAKIDALRGFSRALRKRRTIQKNRKIGCAELLSTMERGWLQPYLMGYHIRKIRHNLPLSK